MLKKNSIILEGKEVEYTLIKTNRRTMGISISIEDGVKISVPKRATNQQIQQLILMKSKWILGKLKDLEGKHFIRQQFKEGEIFYYLGKVYVLSVIEVMNKDREHVEVEDNRLRLHLRADNQENIKKVLLRWYREEANIILKERLEILSEETGLYPQSVMVKEQKSRFGSCSSKRNINLNWKLVMAPLEVIDYVIVHELCHLKEMNHSKNFWSLVESFMNDYKERRKWLKEYGGYIRFI